MVHKGLHPTEESQFSYTCGTQGRGVGFGVNEAQDTTSTKREEASYNALLFFVTGQIQAKLWGCPQDLP